MASSNVMEFSSTRNSNLSRRASSSSTSTTTNPQEQQQQQILSNASNFTSAMTVDDILRDIYNTTTVSTTEATLLDAQITLMDTNEHHQHAHPRENENGAVSGAVIKSVDDVWREIVSGEKKEMKEEAVDEMMTLEDFLAKAGAVAGEEATADVDVKAVSSITERLSGGVYSFDPAPASPFQVEGSIFGLGNGAELVGGGVSGRRKRGREVLKPLDKAAQQRQRRMIKNRESAARSREMKQSYQVELESLAVRLEEENERLLKEKAEKTKERYKQLMEKVVPVVEKRKPPRVLGRVHSMQW